MKPNHHSARPELVEGPFFLSTPNKKDGASTSSAQTAWESATPDGPAAPFASDATTREARREQQNGRRGAKGQQQKIGRASWRETGCPYVLISEVDGSRNKKKIKKK